MLLGTLGASLFGKLLAGKDVTRGGKKEWLRRSNIEISQRGTEFLMLPYRLTNIEIQK